MKISYDKKVDALYIKLVENKTEVINHRLTDDIAVNYDSKGNIVGIEILSVKEHFFKTKDVKIKLENVKAA